MFSSSGFETQSYASDEEGYSHRIKFENGNCSGIIHTEEGKIAFIETTGEPVEQPPEQPAPHERADIYAKSYNDGLDFPDFMRLVVDKLGHGVVEEAGMVWQSMEFLDRMRE